VGSGIPPARPAGAIAPRNANSGFDNGLSGFAGEAVRRVTEREIELRLELILREGKVEIGLLPLRAQLRDLRDDSGSRS